jgi:hypothetical protein
MASPREIIPRGRTGRPGREEWRFANQTQPVGLGSPATLQAPLAGPPGKSS